MFDQTTSPALFFMFSPSSIARQDMMVEAVAAEILEEDRSVTPDTYERHWSGSERELRTLLDTLGFSILDQQGILASLHSHREIALKLKIDRMQVEKAGFTEPG